MICKILRLFVNTLTADDNYSLLNREYLTQPIQVKLFKKQRMFSESFSAVLESRSNFEHFLRKMTLKANGLLKTWLETSVKGPVCNSFRQAIG